MRTANDRQEQKTPDVLRETEDTAPQSDASHTAAATSANALRQEQQQRQQRHTDARLLNDLSAAAASNVKTPGNKLFRALAGFRETMTAELRLLVKQEMTAFERELDSTLTGQQIIQELRAQPVQQKCNNRIGQLASYTEAPVPGDYQSANQSENESTPAREEFLHDRVGRHGVGADVVDVLHGCLEPRTNALLDELPGPVRVRLRNVINSLRC